MVQPAHLWEGKLRCMVSGGGGGAWSSMVRGLELGLELTIGSCADSRSGRKVAEGAPVFSFP